MTTSHHNNIINPLSQPWPWRNPPPRPKLAASAFGGDCFGHRRRVECPFDARGGSSFLWRAAAGAARASAGTARRTCNDARRPDLRARPPLFRHGMASLGSERVAGTTNGLAGTRPEAVVSSGGRRVARHQSRRARRGEPATRVSTRPPQRRVSQPDLRAPIRRSVDGDRGI